MSLGKSPICEPAHKLQPNCPDPSQAEHGQAMTFVGVLPITTRHALSTSHKRAVCLWALQAAFSQVPLKSSCSPGDILLGRGTPDQT